MILNKTLSIFALTISLMVNPYENSLLLAEDSAVDSTDSLVSDVFMKRHSGIDYEPNEYPTPEYMEAMIQAARWAPSSFNDQPWNFIVCDKLLTPEAYDKALDSIIPSQQTWAKNAPILVIVVARTKFAYNGKVNEWAQYDTGAAALNMALQASELDLMAHTIGGYNKEKIIEGFAVPKDFEPQSIIAIGYEHKKPEPQPKPRVRRIISENFFLGEWGQGWAPI